VPLRGPVGERVERPATAAEIERGYELAVGKLVVDLRDADLMPGTTEVDASVGVGELIVYVPGDVSVRVESHVGIGGNEVFGRDEDGWDVELTSDASSGAGVPLLVLDANVGIGDLEVTRG
jgi:hypothetical protein